MKEHGEYEQIGLHKFPQFTIGRPRFIMLHFIALLRYGIFYKLKVCGSPALSKPTSAIFPTAFAHFVSLVSHFGNSFFFFNLFLFIYFCLHWVFNAARGLSLVAASGGYSSLWFAGLSLQWVLLLWSTGSRRMGFSSCGLQALERRLSSRCSAACGIFPDQGSNLCPLSWQADS